MPSGPHHPPALKAPPALAYGLLVVSAAAGQEPAEPQNGQAGRHACQSLRHHELEQLLHGPTTAPEQAGHASQSPATEPDGVSVGSSWGSGPDWPATPTVRAIWLPGLAQEPG